MAGDDTTGSRPTVEQLEQLLISGTDEDCCLYCIMDGFWADGLYGRLLNSSDLSWAHLFQGDVATRRVQQAPFIIALKRGHHLTRWLLEKGWGQGWGIYFTVSTRTAKRHYGTPPIHDKRFLPSNEEDIKLGNLLGGREDVLWAIRRHFRQFSDVILEDNGKIVDFRYYDPWVSYSYLTTASQTQYRAFTAILSSLFGEAAYISRPREVFDFPLYHMHCPEERITFRGGEKELGYQMNFPLIEGEEVAVSPVKPLMVVSAGQRARISQLRQEKFAYLIHEKLEQELDMPLDYGAYQQLRDIIHHCITHGIRKREIIYQFIQYYILHQGFIYDLAQFSEEASGREREIFIEKLLNEKMAAGKQSRIR